MNVNIPNYGEAEVILNVFSYPAFKIGNNKKVLENSRAWNNAWPVHEGTIMVQVGLAAEYYNEDLKCHDELSLTHSPGKMAEALGEEPKGAKWNALMYVPYYIIKNVKNGGYITFVTDSGKSYSVKTDNKFEEYLKMAYERGKKQNFENN